MSSKVFFLALLLVYVAAVLEFQHEGAPVNSFFSRMKKLAAGTVTKAKRIGKRSFQKMKQVKQFVEKGKHVVHKFNMVGKFVADKTVGMYRKVASFPKNMKKAVKLAKSTGKRWAQDMGYEATRQLNAALKKAHHILGKAFTPGKVANSDHDALRAAANAYKFTNEFIMKGYKDRQTYAKNMGAQPGARSFMSFDGKRLIIAFAGSQSFSDVKSDMDGFRKKDFLGVGGVHMGFAAEYNKVRRSVMADVDTLIKIATMREIIVSGHSLGGAQAFLAALDIKKHFPHVFVRVVTAGAPAIGDKRFVYNYNRMNIPTTRYEHGLDLVANLAKVAGWKHVGYAINLHAPALNSFQYLISKTSVASAIVEGIYSGTQHYMKDYMKGTNVMENARRDEKLLNE